MGRWIRGFRQKLLSGKLGKESPDHLDWAKWVDHAVEFGLSKEALARAAPVKGAYVQSIGSGELGSKRSTQGAKDIS